MRLLRSLVVSVVLCLLLGASVASAADAPSTPAGREVSFISHILGRLGGLFISLTSPCSDAGMHIDPWGRCTPSAGATPETDQAGQIDPWG
jgi:hypothetical protein